MLILAHNDCLITPKIAEIIYNEIFIDPLLQRIEIDAPLNIRSILRFGNGTKRIMGGILNATLMAVKQAAPNLIN